MIPFYDEYNLPTNKEIPFGDLLNKLFFNPDPQQNRDYPIHGPNVLRFVGGMSELDLKNVPGLLVGSSEEQEKAAELYSHKKKDVFDALDASGQGKEKQVIGLLKIAALYHDIGKVIRRANHPQIGLNLLRHIDADESRKLITALGDGNAEAGRNRFSLICSVAQHHDKFGVVSTGEGGLPIFSDILYFTSDKDSEDGIKKNVTAVMLLNLADIAAVAVDSSKDRAVLNQGFQLVQQIGKLRAEGKPNTDECKQLQVLGANPSHCLGLRYRKVEDILNDWDLLLRKSKEVDGDRGRLKSALLREESNPARTIIRVRRLLVESMDTTGCGRLLKFVDKTSVENALVGNLGAHQFEYFCGMLAQVVKLDYGLKFFQSLVRACVRQSLHSRGFKVQDVESQVDLTAEELVLLNEDKSTPDLEVERIAMRVNTLFVKVIQKLVSRYTGVLDATSSNSRRFGFQLRDLTGDGNIWRKILSLLCKEQNTEHIGLTWIADEVSIWSMD